MATTTRRELADVRRAALRHTRARVARDHAIQLARDAGAPLRQIADAAGLTSTGVMKILRRLQDLEDRD